jgi:Domain of unknown function (DUF4375)
MPALDRPTACEELAVSDAHTDMLALAVRLAAAEGERALTPAERQISDIMWIGTQVSPNGFDGWLAYTSSERMRGTLAALRELGCTEVLAVVEEALALAGVDPASMDDDKREHTVDRLTDEQRDCLALVDQRFYDVYEPSMELVARFAVDKGLGPPRE